MLQGFLVPPLLAAHQRRPHHELGAGLESQDLVDDLALALPFDGASADPAVRMADAGVEQAEVVVDLRDRPHRGPGIARRCLLVDGDGRGQALYGVDVRLVHLPEELAGVRRQALHVAALTFGVDGIEGEARLTRSREAGYDYETVAREPEGDVLEVAVSYTH